MPNPWEIDWGTPQADPVIAPADPYKQAQEGRAQEDQVLQRQQSDLQNRVTALTIAEKERTLQDEQAKQAKASNAKSDAASKLANVIDKIDQVAFDAADNNGWFETGATGSLMRKLGPDGTPAFDLAGNIKTIDANAAFNALAEMRANSPTGGALGNVTERELELLTSSVANLNPNQSQSQFLTNLAEAKKVYLELLGRLDPDAAKSYAEKPGIRYDANGPYLAKTTGQDDRERQTPFGGNPEPGAPVSPGGGDATFLGMRMGGMDEFKAGVGDIVQAGGDLLGLVGNPVNVGVNAVFGTNLSTDLGETARSMAGLPHGNPTQEAINRFGAAALSGSLAARGGAALASPGVAKSALSIIGQSPIRDTAAGMSAGALGQAGKATGIPGGELAGNLVGGVAGYGAASGVNALTQGARSTPNALMQAAGRQNVTMLPADVGGTATKMATGVARRTLGEIPIAAAAQKSIASGRMARDNVARDIGAVTDKTGAGQAAQRGVREWLDKSADKVDTLYASVPIAPETPLNLGASRQALAELTAGFKSNPELAKIWANNPRLRATLEALTPTDTRQAGQVQYAQATDKVRYAEKGMFDAKNAAIDLRNEQLSAREAVDVARAKFSKMDPNNTPVSALSQARNTLAGAQARFDRVKDLKPDAAGIAAWEKMIVPAKNAQDEAFVASRQPPIGGELSWGDAARLRSIVGKIIDKPGITSDGNEVAALRKFYGALTSDMEITAAQTSPRALSMWRRATQFKRGRENRIETVLTSIMGDKNLKGEMQAFEQINRWSQQQGGDFKKVAQALRSMDSEEANTVRATLLSKLGDARQGSQNAEGDVFSPAAFVTQWNGLDKRARAMLFPSSEHRAAINDLVDVFDAMKSASAYENPSKTALGANAAVLGTTALYSPIVAGLSALGQLGVGKILASPGVARVLARAPRTKSPVALKGWLSRLEAAAGRTPTVGAEIATLKQSILSASNDNAALTGNVAAQPNDEQ